MAWLGKSDATRGYSQAILSETQNTICCLYFADRQWAASALSIPRDSFPGNKKLLETFRSVMSLLASYGLLLLANGMFGTLLAIRSRMQDFTTELLGLMTGGFFLGLLIGARYAPTIVATVGHIRAFAAFASIASVVALVHILWVDPMVWIGLRLLTGICMAGMFTVTESWLNARASNENRGRILGLYMVTNYGAAGLGQLILPLGDIDSFQLFAVASIIYSLALVPVLLTRAVAPVPEIPARSSIRKLVAISPLGFFGTLAAGLMTAPFHGLGPVYAREVGLTLDETSVFMAITITSGLLLQIPVGFLSDRLGRQYVIGGMAAITAGLSVAVLLASDHSYLRLLVSAGLWGACAFTLYSLCSAHTNDRALAGQTMEVAAGLLLAFGIGAITGPILVSTLMERFGPNMLFVAGTVIATVLALVAFWRVLTAPVRRRAMTWVPAPSAGFTSGRLFSAFRAQREKDMTRFANSLRGL